LIFYDFYINFSSHFLIAIFKSFSWLYIFFQFHQLIILFYFIFMLDLVLIFLIGFLFSNFIFNIGLVNNWISWFFLMRWSYSHDLGHRYEMLTQINIDFFILFFISNCFLFHHSIFDLLKIELVFFCLALWLGSWVYNANLNLFTDIFLKNS
jgi:hypothetical protein